MNVPRFVIVTPRYWPQVGERESLAADLADELAEMGGRPTVVSAKWAAHWPELIRVREVDVVRMPHAPLGRWSRLRYLLDLSRWLRLRRRQAEMDAVYVLSLGYEAYAAVAALRGSGIPVLLHGPVSDPSGERTGRSVARIEQRLRQRCREAEALVTEHATAADAWVQAGYRRDRVHVIPQGVRLGPERSADRRYRARAALSEVNHDLAAAEYAPVVVCVGDLSAVAPLMGLLQAWREIASRWPSARLWLIGDGPAREALFEQVVTWDLRYQVFLPGSFEDLADVWLAADVCVVPDPRAGCRLATQAAATGLPIVATDGPEIKSVVEHGNSGLLVPPGDRAAWRDALGYFCEHAAARLAMGQAARRIVAQRFGRRAMAERYAELIESLRTCP